MSKYSSGVEINNFGYVTKKIIKYYNYVNSEVPESMVCDLGYELEVIDIEIYLRTNRKFRVINQTRTKNLP